MLMAQGSIGMEKDSQRKSSPVSRYLLATLLAVVAMWKFKGVASLFFLDVLFKPYQVSLANNPLITKVLTGAILAIAGDAMAQAASNAAAVANNEKEVGYDKRRALSFAVFDSGYRFCQHHMFPAIIRYCQGNVIMNILPRIIPSKSLVAMLAPAAAAVEQTAVYQLGIVPVSYLLTKSSCNGLPSIITKCAASRPHLMVYFPPLRFFSLSIFSVCILSHFFVSKHLIK